MYNLNLAHVHPIDGRTAVKRFAVTVVITKKPNAR